MKKNNQAAALLLAVAMAGTMVLPVWAQTPETAAGDIAVVEATWEEVLAARERLAALPQTMAEDSSDAEAMSAIVERTRTAVQQRSSKVQIQDLQLDKDLVMSILVDLSVIADGSEAIDRMSCSYYSDSEQAVYIGLTYCTEDDAAAMQARLNQLTERTNALCRTEEEKVLYVHDWLVQNIAYNFEDSRDDDYNAKGALLDGISVCEGYAKAYALAMQKQGIPCLIVTSGDLHHAWNMVQLNGNWYQVDCTWDDPANCQKMSDALGLCQHKNLLCTTEEFETDRKADDFVAFDLENLGTQNIAAQAVSDTYADSWWKNSDWAIFPCGDGWYYVSVERLRWREGMDDDESEVVLDGEYAVAAGCIAMDGTTLVVSNARPGENDDQGTWIKTYELDPDTHSVTLKKKEDVDNLGVATMWDGIYYAASQNEHSQEIKKYISTAPDPTPTPVPTPTAAPTATPTATPTAAPTATPVKPTATPVKPTATPVPGYNGWKTENGKDYWYENGVKQGTTGRGKEIYDPDSDAWYWLDAVQGGAKTVSKDVYQDSNGGKWVRYDENGHMVKGWDTNEDGTYYFDLITGAMTKGDVTINGLPCSFDINTGIGLDSVWKRIGGRDYWYENGERQGYDPNDAAYRGKEIYDPASDAWYWLDNVQQGAKAVSKDVYQESEAGDWADKKDGTGKWVRYDANGHMIKGWSTNENGTYYFDPVYGTMAKGAVRIQNRAYYFDPATGVLQ